ncbi:cytidine deaminase [Robiginitalea sp. M366]|uniref:cytidine deaminase n=1 Tax=Robiginitalea aestuariiviva TaxID=3036903 RepID=UPI00240E50B9|nr:cytidine deaminase [Robiginitalea aestuariiviva]MDG1572052.1 cytidine deaminase [Robiginitalea aestuariiviva]
MEKRHIGFELLIYPGADALEAADRELLGAAQQAMAGAYAPYSGYRVGAALRLENGTLVLGSNQENASYPSGLCAERVAVFQAGARFPGQAIQTIAICVEAPEEKQTNPAAPCGNCRQSILEYEHRQGNPIRFLLQAGNGPVYECPSTRALLPLGFTPDFLD